MKKYKKMNEKNNNEEEFNFLEKTLLCVGAFSGGMGIGFAIIDKPFKPARDLVYSVYDSFKGEENEQ